MSTSSNNIKVFVQCCPDKHTVASSRTLLSLHVYDYRGCVMLLSARSLCFNTNNNIKYCKLIKMWCSVERFIEFFRSANRRRSCTFFYIFLHGVWPNKRLYNLFGGRNFIRNVGTYPSNYMESRKYRLSQSKGKSVWYTLVNLKKPSNSKRTIKLKTSK